MAGAVTHMCAVCCVVCVCRGWKGGWGDQARMFAAPVPCATPPHTAMHPPSTRAVRRYTVTPTAHRAPTAPLPCTHQVRHAAVRDQPAVPQEEFREVAQPCRWGGHHARLRHSKPAAAETPTNQQPKARHCVDFASFATHTEGPADMGSVPQAEGRGWGEANEMRMALFAPTRVEAKASEALGVSPARRR